MRTFSTLCAVALAATAAHALPDVKPVQLGAECHNYPEFNAAKGEAGPWPLYASSTDGQVAWGVGSTVFDVIPGAQAKFRIGMAVLPTQGKLILKCTSNGLLAYYPTSWAAVTRGPDDKAFLMVGQEGVTELQAHAHFFANGTQQEGVFLGSGGHTTWAYKRRTDSNGRDGFRIRLLVGSDSLEEGEFKGFARIGAP
ncbi:hypothetical protein MAPG_06945 [Magnaporthiopsis poae ATCC 64411]|uniref:Uncharacterized protein n=1 Tax=Magnaporthiopsis poae (strain ATCC 64411 / 73-15) TaxID=644358 RepID=A0A0C4E3E6_MAGP6|nr:hypothetical protein MAPG_06945 [Magnaporthiopsis poae ATCC 64411]